MCTQFEHNLSDEDLALIKADQHAGMSDEDIAETSDRELLAIACWEMDIDDLWDDPNDPETHALFMAYSRLLNHTNV